MYGERRQELSYLVHMLTRVIMPERLRKQDSGRRAPHPRAKWGLSLTKVLSVRRALVPYGEILQPTYIVVANESTSKTRLSRRRRDQNVKEVALLHQHCSKQEVTLLHQRTLWHTGPGQGLVSGNYLRQNTSGVNNTKASWLSRWIACRLRVWSLGVTSSSRQLLWAFRCVPN